MSVWTRPAGASSRGSVRGLTVSPPAVVFVELTPYIGRKGLIAPSAYGLLERSRRRLERSEAC